MNIDTLPQFILVRGERRKCYAFATELLSRDKTSTILQDDLHAPVFEAMVQSLFDDAFLDIDIDNLSTWDRILPFGKITISDYIRSATEDMRKHLGPSILGELFVRGFQSGLYSDLCHTMVIRDFDDAADLAPFLNTYGQSSIVLVELDSMYHVTAARSTHWIASLDPKQQVDQFLKDLNSEKRRPKSSAEDTTDGRPNDTAN